KCGDNWVGENEYIEELEGVERSCYSCNFFGMPEENIISDAQLKAFVKVLDRVEKKLKNEEFKNG
ncbi:MAG: hypothetical protein GY757_19195, partial [bacterium]|nr:hypothetical protein [bacterium]